VGAPKAHAIGACPTLVQGTDFTTFSDLQTLFTAQRFCDEGSMTVDFTSDFTWPDDASLTWDGQDHQPLLLRGTGPNTPTVTGYKAAVIVNNSDGGLTVSNLTIKKGDVGQDNAIFGSVGNVVLNNATVLGRAGEANGRAIRTGDGDVSITNSTIKDNNTGSGAGVSVDGAHSNNQLHDQQQPSDFPRRRRDLRGNWNGDDSEFDNQRELSKPRQRRRNLPVRRRINRGDELDD
jgi:hypothetical protein